MLERALALTAGGEGRDFPDGDQIASWAREAVDVLSSLGLINGTDGGSFAPGRPITRGETVTILDRAVAGYYDRAGVYTESGRGPVTIIAAPGVTLRDAEITGDLIIAPGAAGSETILSGVTVAGTTHILSGRDNQVLAMGESDLGDVSVSGTDARLKLEEGAAVASLTVTGGGAHIRGLAEDQEVTVAEGAESAVRQEMQECLENRETAKGLAMEAALLRRAETRLETAVGAQRARRNLTLLAFGAMNAAARLGCCAVLLWGVVRAGRGEMTLGSLAAALQLLLQLRGPVLALSGLAPRLSALSASAERLMELETLPGEEAPPIPAGAAARALVLSHVDFRYPEDERAVLRDFSLRLEAGEWLCLTGPSGRGKSTVFRLLLGFYAPQSGAAYLETDRGQIPCGAAARPLLGYVPQRHTLFCGTIRENLLLAAPEAGEEALWAALEGAGADFVRHLPQGLDTPVQENGGGLSEGQGQRIAIARALLLDAPFLLLDEATSALDRETETMVLRRLRESGRGALLVSHRPEALPEGTKILPMEEEP